jgi:phage shock protein A
MFKRLSNLLKGFFGLFLSNAERSNPEALLEVERENLRKQIAQYNQGLASHAALCERLMTQVKNLEQRERELRAKATANLRAGNREAAGNFALDLQQVQGQLEENRKQLETAEATYKDLEKAREVSVQAAREKIEKLRYAIGDMKVQKSTAEMMEMATGMISQIGGSGDTLNRLEEMVQEEREKAAGRARVARGGLDMTEISMKESEQAALADQALADFAAKEGIVLDAPANAAPGQNAPANKQMGPTASFE